MADHRYYLGYLDSRHYYPDYLDSRHYYPDYLDSRYYYPGCNAPSYVLLNSSKDSAVL